MLQSRAERLSGCFREEHATAASRDSHVVGMTLPVCDRDMGPGPDQL